MALLEFVRRADARQLRVMLLLTLLAGLANAALIVIITRVAEMVSLAERPGPITLGLFLGAFALYYAANQLSLIRAMHIVEALLTERRLAVADRLRRSELLVADKLGRARLFTLVATETNHLSVTFPLIVQALQQMVLLAVTLAYLLYLSPLAFAVFVASVGCGALGYRAINARFADVLRHVARMQERTMEAVRDIIDGAKEMRLSSALSDAVELAYRRRSHALETLLVRSVEHWVMLILLGSLVMFGMLGVVVFAFPHYASGEQTVIFQLIPILILCIGTLTGTLAQSPMFMRAEAGLQSLDAIDAELSAGPGISPDQARDQAGLFADFTRIALHRAEFSYDAQNPEAYSVGPLDLELTRGEVVFLVGGNGSGKSTALRMLTGLYPLRTGWIEVDETEVNAVSLAGYRELFSSVFVDFHLFDQLYGLENLSSGRVNEFLTELGLSAKVRFEEGRFSQIHLSTGQRKRLALIVALLEDRPICVFDEWSAEQDVEFRDFFYRIVIPALRERGKLVIATSHDEKYWDAADRVIKLDLGQVDWTRPGNDLRLGEDRSADRGSP